ncbi:C2-domain-containing protein [Rickenella mellea]|uniref:C2-domain-containing protein n=1 Tax=Rickenella mellea TaxID=50990 RepID=A0A4Y7PUW5_9AGAM|nr:C2-domain-containing protein [Rickenella mellea]
MNSFRRSPYIYPATSMFHRLHDTIRGVADAAKDLAADKLPSGKFIDVSIQFIGASGLPKMDLVGTADPYFIAKLDDKITFISSVQPNTLTPVWNEIWNVKNVPDNAVLKVEVLDKDEGAPKDDYIGNFETTLTSGPKEVEIVGSILKQVKGTFWLKITSTPSADPPGPAYTFNGPIRYSRHSSPTVGLLANLNDQRLYSTWKMHIKGVPLFFGDHVQPWNRNYKAAQSIFQGPSSMAVRAGIQAGHRMLYARSTTNGFGIIDRPEDVHKLLRGGPHMNHRVKPAVYTYIIAVQDDTFRFSETGAAFFVDFASKHALHSNCAESVRYSGEFHPRPQGGWDKFSEDTPDDKVNWELVIDNNSGTYSPDKELLPQVKACLEYNFPGFTIHALDFHDEELERSRTACREYALKNRGVRQTELQPHTTEGEETLMHHASVHSGKDQPQSSEGGAPLTQYPTCQIADGQTPSSLGPTT